MRPLTSHEIRTIRIGAVVLLALFVVFGISQASKRLAQRRAEYRQLALQADRLKQEVQLYDERAAVVKKLMEASRLDPAKLLRTNVVAEASAAIQRAALGGGLVVGSVRESPARAANRELASVQIEGSGPVPAVMGFLSRLETLGFPLIIESVQLTGDMRPGALKVNLTILILDFDQWTKEGSPHA